MKNRTYFLTFSLKISIDDEVCLDSRERMVDYIKKNFNDNRVVIQDISDFDMYDKTNPNKQFFFITFKCCNFFPLHESGDLMKLRAEDTVKLADVCEKKVIQLLNELNMQVDNYE